ncbi:MAG: ribulose-phosphate 3-epimerase [Armatimonadetes bacterium]|nr:ribulose-phosphate 3-epimerase [Armatimonadota bacterium]
MNPKIAPSILSCDPSDFRRPVKEMIDGGADWIHFDVMDGQFVPPITFGAGLVRSLRGLGGTPFEAHLMTETPDRHFDAFIEAGCQRVVFHVEATPHAHRHVQRLRQSGVQAGIALNPGTPFETVLPLLGGLDVVLVMTVNPGWGGQSLIEKCIEKVAQVRLADPDVEIEVDGGVEPLTIGRLWEAGATTFVTGSYLVSGGTIRGNIEELKNACVSKS